MAITLDEEIDLLAAAGLLEEPEDLPVPEPPAWLLEQLVGTPSEPPLCACGCGRSELEVWGEADVAAPAPAPAPAVSPSPEPEPEPVRWAVPGVWDDEPTPEKVTPSVGEDVAALTALVDRLLAVDPTSLSAGQALGEAAALTTAQHALRVLQLGRTRDVGARRLYEHLGYRSTGAWHRDTAPDTPSGDPALASALPELPHLAAALTAQRVSFQAAGKVKIALGKVRTHLDRPDGLVDGQAGEPVIEAVCHHVLELICTDKFGREHDPDVDAEQAAFLQTVERELVGIQFSAASQRERVERAMVLLAEHVNLPALTAALQDVVLQIVPNKLEQQDKAAQDKRALSLNKNSDGTWQLDATLTPEVGEQLFTALAAEARRDPANPLDTHAREAARAAAAEAEGKDGWVASQDRPQWEARALRENGESFAPDADELVPRSRSKRLHDALGRLLGRYLEKGLGGVSGKVPVQVTVTTSHRTVDGTPGAPPTRGASGQALARGLLHRWWCDAHVTVLLMSQGWKPLGIVHRGRTLTGIELTAARVQFGNRCPGIDCCSGQPDPLIPLVPHHIRMFSEDGFTSLELTLLVCERLHADLHIGKRVIRLRDGRLISEDGYLHDAD